MELLKIKLEEKREVHALDFYGDAFYFCNEFKPQFSSFTLFYFICFLV